MTNITKLSSMSQISRPKIKYKKLFLSPIDSYKPYCIITPIMTAEHPEVSGRLAHQNGLMTSLEQFTAGSMFGDLPDGYRGTALRSAQFFLTMPDDLLLKRAKYSGRIPAGDPLAHARGKDHTRISQYENVRRLMIAEGVGTDDAERDARILLRASLAVDAAREELNLRGITDLTRNQQLCLGLAAEAVFHVENDRKYPASVS